jgi:hypothetical protein
LANLTAQQIGVCALATTPLRVDNEVLDLEEAVEPKIPMGDLLWIKSAW